MKKIVQKVIKFFLPLLLGGYIFWYLYHSSDTKEIGNILQSGIRYQWIILSMFIGLLSHVLRAYRWRIQLVSLNIFASARSLINAIFGTYAVNLLFPRLGEVWRCGYIARREKSSFTKILGSVVSDRITDTITVALITGVVFLFQMNIFFDFLKDFPLVLAGVQNTLLSPWLYIGIIGTIALCYILLKKLKDTRIVKKLKEIIFNLWEGFSTVLQMKHKMGFILYTIAIWTCYFLQLYVCIFAFDFSSNLTVLETLTLFVMGSISMALPVQGGIGPWHFAIISTMMLFGIGKTEAATFALVAHGSQMLLICLLGIYTMISIAIENRPVVHLETTK